MPTVIGVRVHSHGAYGQPTIRDHTDGRCFSYADAGNLRIHAEGRPDPIAVYQPAAWDHVEVVYGEDEQPRIEVNFAGGTTKDTIAEIRSALRDIEHPRAGEPETEQPTFTWPYDPTSGTVSTDDVVEQAKHEAADHIRRAKAVARGEDLLGFVDELERTADVLAVVADGASDAPHRERRVRTLRTIAARLRAIVQSDDEAAA